MSEFFSDLKLHAVKDNDRIGKTQAFVSCKIHTPLGAIKLNNMHLRKGERGLFLSYPKRSDKQKDKSLNGFDDFFYFEEGPRRILEAAAIALYHETLGANDPKSSEKPGFPALVKYLDNEEFVVVDRMEDISRTRSFVFM